MMKRKNERIEEEQKRSFEIVSKMIIGIEG